MAEALIYAAGIVGGLSDAEFESLRSELGHAVNGLTASLKPSSGASTE
jgi:hypothetical protein